MFLASPGAGKTATTLAAYQILKQKKLCGAMLVVAPLRVAKYVWPQECLKWTDFKDLKVEVLHGVGIHGYDDVEAGADIYTINPESLLGLLRKDALTKSFFKRLNIDVLVCDELTLWKNYASKRFKMLKPRLGEFRRRWGLTGTPAANGLMDLFGQAFTIDQGRSLGPYVTHFRLQHFHQPRPFVWEPLPGAEAKIYERLSPIALRLDAADYLELPQQIDNIIRLDLPEEARLIYDQVQDDMFSQLSSTDKVVALNAAAAVNKCRQVAGGAVYLSPDVDPLEMKPVPTQKPWKLIHDIKIEALESLVEELQGTPLLVAYEFRHDLERLLAKFGQNTPFVGRKDTEQLLVDWNKGKIPIMLGHPQAMAHGLNLQGSGNHLCWFTLTWDYERYDQSIRRLLRQGQNHDRVFVHHLIVRNTVDEAVLGSLRRKKKGQDSLFAALQEYQQNQGLYSGA